MDTMPDILRIAVPVLLAVVIVPLLFLSENMREQFKKILLFFLVFIGLGAGYYFFTGKSPTEIPADINVFFNGPQAPPDEMSHKYYRDSHKLYEESLKD